MTHAINYGSLMHRAMRDLILDVLRDVEKNGLPGDHHFFITFDTDHPKAGIPERLYERHKGELTVVLQHWFEDLDVCDDGFAVTLKFDGVPEPLFIPVDAISTFADPSAEFGLRFETDINDDDVEEAPMDSNPAEVEPKDAEVVSLDSFRGSRK